MAQPAAEELLYNRGNDAEMLLDLAYGLCTSPAPAQEAEWRAVLWSGHMASLLRAEEVERDTDTPNGGAVYLARLRAGLVGVLRQSSLTPSERSDAGGILAQLGDPRSEVLDPLHIEFCTIIHPAQPTGGRGELVRSVGLCALA